MIIELGEGLMTILVLCTIFMFIVAPELVFLVVVVSIMGIVGFSATGKELTIKSKDAIILQLNVDKDTNTTKIQVGEDE